MTAKEGDIVYRADINCFYFPYEITLRKGRVLYAHPAENKGAPLMYVVVWGEHTDKSYVDDHCRYFAFTEHEALERAISHLRDTVKSHEDTLTRMRAALEKAESEFSKKKTSNA